MLVWQLVACHTTLRDMLMVTPRVLSDDNVYTPIKGTSSFAHHHQTTREKCNRVRNAIYVYVAKSSQ